MFASYLVSTGRMTLNTALTLLLCIATSSPALAEITKEIASEPRATTPATGGAAIRKTGRIARAIFTTAIVDREPVDSLEILSTDISRVFFFTDLRGLDGQIITHRWEYNDQTMAEITFRVGSGARWRVYSSKNLLPEWTGTWTVVVNTGSGETLHTSTFEYMAATPAAE